MTASDPLRTGILCVCGHHAAAGKRAHTTLDAGAPYGAVLERVLGLGVLGDMRAPYRHFGDGASGVARTRGPGDRGLDRVIVNPEGVSGGGCTTVPQSCGGGVCSRGCRGVWRAR